MPYTSMEEVNPAIRGIKPPVTLAQANLIAKWADAMEGAEDGPGNPWAVAIAQFKKAHTVRDGKWIVKEGKAMDVEFLDIDGEQVAIDDLKAAYKAVSERGKLREEKEEEAISPNTLKAISKDADTVRAANYLVLWNVRDLEGIASGRVNPDGSRGEYFTPETDFESEYTKTGRLYVDWEHGLSGRWYGEDGTDIPAPGRDDILGYVDWSTAKADKHGLWVERVLNRRNRYMKFLEMLLDAGLIGTSSETPAKSTEKAADGRIVKWPLKRDTMTVSPMEWRMMKENPLLVQAVKGLLELPDELPEPDDGGDDAGASCQDELEVARAKAEIDILLTEIDMEV